MQVAFRHRRSAGPPTEGLTPRRGSLEPWPLDGVGGELQEAAGRKSWGLWLQTRNKSWRDRLLRSNAPSFGRRRVRALVWRLASWETGDEIDGLPGGCRLSLVA